jgi:hypothetical protein
MGSYFPRSIVAAATIAVACASAAGRARGQDEAPNPSRRVAGPTPRTADGKVDFSGIWSPDRKFIYDINDALKPGETLPLQPWALKTARQRMSKDDPEANCLPAGVPRQAPYPWRIVQTATHNYEVTIDDPGAYTRPFTLYGHHAYESATELMEYICNENNRDVQHIVGKDPRNKYSKP